MSDREWRVSWGYYSDRHAYEGSNTFLAGLNHARTCRKGRDVDTAGSFPEVIDLSTLDEDGDQKTEEEESFFQSCSLIGMGYKWRGTWDHSWNWVGEDGK